MRTLFLSLTLLCVCCAAEARMYQWFNPATGRAELSGTPPAWYRSGAGPRVRVYENGNIIDDTSIALSPEHEQMLRETAFAESRQLSERASVARLERLAARQNAVNRATAPVSSQRSIAADTPADAITPDDGEDAAGEQAAVEEEVATAIDSDLIEQFKALVREFDAQLQRVPTEEQ